MSRIGRQPITIPEAVKLDITADTIKVTGAKGELSLPLHRQVKLSLEGQQLIVTRINETKASKSLHGTYQRLITNMVTGVTTGFTKNLELVGTGYRVAKAGNKITLSLGLSHAIDFEPPAGTTINIEGNNKIEISGIDKQVVGQVAANIRAFKPPEPYKGKGIRYTDEVIRRKAGKAAKAAAA